MPLKNASVPSSVARPLRLRISSHTMAMTKDRIEASCTLMSILRPVMEVMANTTSSMMIGSSGRMPYTTRYRVPPSISLTSASSISPSSTMAAPPRLSMNRCQK